MHLLAIEFRRGDFRRPTGPGSRLREPRLLMGTTAHHIDVDGHRVFAADAHGHGHESVTVYDQLVIGTGAVPVRPPIAGLDTLGPGDGVHVRHTMDDTFPITTAIDQRSPGPRSSSGPAT